MTHPIKRSVLVLFGASALGACATNSEALRPNFPISREPAAAPAPPPPPVAAAPAPADDVPQARPTAPVESRPLDLPPPAAAAAPPPSVVAPPVAAAPPPPTYRTVTSRSVTGRVVDADGPPKTHEVKSGDNLEKIAKALGTTVEQLKDDNKLKTDVIRPGQELKGPKTTAKAYVVGQGDTLFSIARRFSVTAAAVAEENEMRSNATLKVGQRLRLPDGYRDRGPIVTTTRVLVEPPPTPAMRPAPAPVQTAQAAPPPAPAVQAAPVQPAPVQTPTAQAAPPQRTPATAQAAGSISPTTTGRPLQTAQATPAPRPQTSAPPAPSSLPPIGARPAAPPVTEPRTQLPSGPRPYTPPSRPNTAATSRPFTPNTGATSVAGAPVATPPPSESQLSQLGRGVFIWPVRGDVLSGFGPKGTGQRNDGLNIRASAGESVRAAAAGDVVYAGDQVPGFGNLVLIKHANGWVTAYGHLSRIDVRMQQQVTQGQQIGQVGTTGGVTEPQLHFEVRYAPSPQERARPINPSLVLPSA